MNGREQTAAFATRMWEWFSRHKRTLPWRDLQIAGDTQRAYMILVSEVMLQQTQVPRVEVIFKRFLEQFPTMQALAHASNASVLIAWRGMGYNSRALRLRDAAKQIVSRGEITAAGTPRPSSRCATRQTPQSHAKATIDFPQSMEELTAIKGIGPYTAAAIRNFAFDLPTPCIDTNIRRILHRVFFGPEKTDGTFKVNDRKLLKRADDVLRIALDRTNEKRTNQQTSHWHAALMDFGSLVCTKSQPQCEICPMAKNGLCKAAFKVKKSTATKKKEPGRYIGSTFIQNRIFRGRIIDALRDAEEGLALDEIGVRIALDWSVELHEWLREILKKLEKEALIRRKREKFALEDKQDIDIL